VSTSRTSSPSSTSRGTSTRSFQGDFQVLEIPFQAFSGEQSVFQSVGGIFFFIRDKDDLSPRTYQLDFIQVVVPEPASAILVALGLLGPASRRAA
jgi:hypothetical protein